MSAAALLAACTSNVAGTGHLGALPSPSSAAPSQFPTPSAPPTSAPSIVPSNLVWKRVTDTATGIQFDLPGTPTKLTKALTSADGHAIAQTLYQVALGGTKGIAVSVGVLRGKTVRLTWDLNVYAAGFTKQFKQIGVTDAAVTEQKSSTIAGHRALDFRFSFTSLDPSAGKAVWLVRAIADGGDLVIEQTITFAVEPATVLPVVRQIHARLESGVKLS